MTDTQSTPRRKLIPPFMHVLVMATEPNRYWPLHRKRIQPNIRQLVLFSRKLDMWLGPQGFEYLDLLVRPLTPTTEILAQGCELDWVPTDFYPKPQSPVRKKGHQPKRLGGQPKLSDVAVGSKCGS
jgi:hypothetical protein